MKTFFISLVAIFAVVMSESLSKVAAGEGDIPLSALAGGYVSTVQGSFAICLDPKTFLEESCSTAGTLVLPVSYLALGKITFDNNGNSCDTASQVASNLPVDASPPQVSLAFVAGKTLNYDPASGTGDGSFTAYSGGKCNGAVFDSTGATVVSTGTDHFIVSGNGSTRIDAIFTSLTDAVGGLGDFSLSLIDLQQSSGHHHD